MTKPSGIIIEFISVGGNLKVCAICERTGREISIVGDPKASRAQLSRLAAQKLQYVLRKEAQAHLDAQKGVIV